jgi:serine/threonine protein kinase
LKSVPKDDLSCYDAIFNNLRKCPDVRVADESIPDHSMFVYRYLRDHLLSFAQKDVPLSLTRRILRDSLRGIAALHDEGIVHADIKSNTTVRDWNERDGNITLSRVQIADIDDSAYVSDDPVIVGRELGIGCGEVLRLMHLARSRSHQISTRLELS